MDIFSLKGKKIVITGGAGYLGEAMSDGLAKYGATVVIASRNKEKNEELASRLSAKYNIPCYGYFIDVSKAESVKTTFQKIISDLGGIDVLVNNSYFGISGTVEEMSDKDWSLGIDGSINNVFRCVNAVLPHMKSQKNGNIINIASMYGMVSPNPSIYGSSGYDNPANYGAGKAAIIQFTKYLTCHYGREGIRVNSVSPGPFPNKVVQENKEFLNNLKERSPLGRIGEPEELQGVLVFLASDASSYIAGENIAIDGGWTAW